MKSMLIKNFGDILLNQCNAGLKLRTAAQVYKLHSSFSWSKRCHGFSMAGSHFLFYEISKSYVYHLKDMLPADQTLDKNYILERTLFIGHWGKVALESKSRRGSRPRGLYEFLAKSTFNGYFYENMTEY